MKFFFKDKFSWFDLLAIYACTLVLLNGHVLIALLATVLGGFYFVLQSKGVGIEGRRK